jgi:hypothetical protein
MVATLTRTLGAVKHKTVADLQSCTDSQMVFMHRSPSSDRYESRLGIYAAGMTQASDGSSALG